jgi:hypothetical protein
MTKVVVRESTQVSDRADVSDWAFSRKRVTHETDSIPLINGNSISCEDPNFIADNRAFRAVKPVRINVTPAFAIGS